MSNGLGIVIYLSSNRDMFKVNLLNKGILVLTILQLLMHAVITAMKLLVYGTFYNIFYMI